VTVNGKNSSEVWAGFRVARRARPFGLSVAHDGKELHISCAHDGYTHLPGHPVHRRRWHLTENSLRIEDCVEGRCDSAVANFHLHPGIKCSADESGRGGRLVLPDGHVVRWAVTGGEVSVVPSTYCPQFGLRERTQCIAVSFAGEVSRMCLNW
jgi:uncharacterized heparinase superfamily protein